MKEKFQIISEEDRSVLVVSEGVEYISFFHSDFNRDEVEEKNIFDSSFIDMTEIRLSQEIQSLQIVVPKSVKGIEGFDGKWKLSHPALRIGISVSDEKFSGFLVHPDNLYFSSSNDILYNKNQTKLYCYPGGKKEKRFVLPQGVKWISNTAFRGSGFPEEVVLNSEVEELGNALLCPNLILPDKNLRYKIEDDVLYDKEGSHLLRNFSKRKTFHVKDTVTSIGSFAFSFNQFTEIVTIPSTVKTVSPVFTGCSNLKRVELLKQVTAIESFAFAGCENLEEVILHNSVDTICSYAFLDCKNLRNADFLKGVKQISSNAFDGCEGLTEIIIPEGVTHIRKETFKNCTSLRKVVIPESVKRIAPNAFWGCRIEEMQLHSNDFKIKNQSLYDRKKHRIRYDYKTEQKEG